MTTEEAIFIPTSSPPKVKPKPIPAGEGEVIGEAFISTGSMKTCAHKLCADPYQPTKNFYLSPHTKDGLFSYCKTCARSLARQQKAKRETRGIPYQQRKKQKTALKDAKKDRKRLDAGAAELTTIMEDTDFISSLPVEVMGKVAFLLGRITGDIRKAIAILDGRRPQYDLKVMKEKWYKGPLAEGLPGSVAGVVRGVVAEENA